MKTKTKKKRVSGSLQPGSARALADKIAAALFTSGDGKRASRLQFVLDSGEVWGGWSEPAAARWIEKIIEAQNVHNQGPRNEDPKSRKEE